MTVLVTGSSGHLGEALVRTLKAQRREVVGADILPGASTHQVGSITDRAFVHRCMNGMSTVLHAATLHKPHVATHSRQDFIDVNITGTLNLLEEAAGAGITAFVCTSTTSVFGDALVPPPGKPAAWVTEDVVPVPKNIYGVTKLAAEDLCQLFVRNHSLRVIALLRQAIADVGAGKEPGLIYAGGKDLLVFDSGEAPRLDGWMVLDPVRPAAARDPRHCHRHHRT